MPRPPANDAERRSPLLRRADQATVAVLVLAGLVSLAGYWFFQGGHRGGMIDIERAEPLRADFVVDVNRADWPELAQLPGIGETLAKRIVEVRLADGPYRDHDELQRRVRGIGPRTLEQIEPYLAPIAEDGMVAGN